MRANTVTGCLQKGDEAGEISIAGEDGKLWGLRSSTVKLENQVGHKVTVAEKEGEVENAAQEEEYRDLRVTSVKMISDTCAK